MNNRQKRVVTTLLLGFVVASIVYLVAKESGGKEGTPLAISQPRPVKTDQRGAAATTGRRLADSKVVAYYFHGNVRCRTCRTIEAYTKEAIEAGFPEAVKNGSLEFRAVNVEDPRNEHFVQDYELSIRSVVIARFKQGKEESWGKLPRIWELVRDHDRFVAYVRQETKPFLQRDS